MIRATVTTTLKNNASVSIHENFKKVTPYKLSGSMMYLLKSNIECMLIKELNQIQKIESKSYKREKSYSENIIGISSGG